MQERLDKLRTSALMAGLDAIIVTPGADLRYLTGYEALPLERLTALVFRFDAEPVLVVPELEVAAARASGTELELKSWSETDDPFALVASILGDATTVGVDDQMWASRVFALQEVLPDAALAAAGVVVSELRVRKSPDEIAALRDAANSIDRVHARMGEWLRVGRTEREVADDIAAAIIAEGHVRVDFVIVGSGPNGASPHHDVSDRVIEAGDPVVIDIGGTNAAGYCSDSTRNYVVGGEPEAEYVRVHTVLEEAQRVQREAVRPGLTAHELDELGRKVIAEAGYGDFFIHRTGHGIGQETHEEPYIVAGSDRALEASMAFSIEPGIYLPGRFGARIEDIVVCTQNGGESLNHSPRGFVQL